jgi:hypothetical protein
MLNPVCIGVVASKAATMSTLPRQKAIGSRLRDGFQRTELEHWLAWDVVHAFAAPIVPAMDASSVFRTLRLPLAQRICHAMTCRSYPAATRSRNAGIQRWKFREKANCL